MTGLEVGADIATMLGGAAVLAGVVTWLITQYRGLLARRATYRQRTWHGYIPAGMTSSWWVRLVEEPDAPTARVVLEVLDGRPGTGQPDVNGAHALRQHVTGDGLLARAPTPSEYEFLDALRRERGYGQDPEAVVIR